MKRTILTVAAVLVALGIIATGCLDRKPAPVCPVPIEIASNDISASQFDGVDMLVVVDNSGSMAEEQLILSSGFFTLINSLTKPLLNDEAWKYPAVDNMRVAVVSSDLGLAYGENRDTTLSPKGVQTCEDPLGDNGNFLLPKAMNIDVADGVIKCEADGPDSGGQCPAGFTCGNFDAVNIGRCMAPGVGTVACPNMGNATYASTSSEVFNPDLTTQVACMGQQGTSGCGFEQQLEAAVVGLNSHPDFIVDTHLLSVIIVSDEEDCSIENPALFSTTEWTTPQLQNTACNVPSGEPNLFPTSRYIDKFKTLKKGSAAAVIFAAIVGVPTEAESEAAGLPKCEGLGTDIGMCLDPSNTLMTIKPKEFQDSLGNPYIHFTPACVRENPADPTTPFTEARPGRRYVQVAQDFQENSYVYSICNEDWSPAMKSIAEIIAKQISSSCYAKKLEWTQLPADKQPMLNNGSQCTNCGEAECDVVVRIQRGVTDSEDCPAGYYKDLTDAEAQVYLNKKVVEPVTSANGQVTLKNIWCPLPKLPTPRACSQARTAVNDKNVGWYYCEETSEDFYNACRDGNDNDGNGYIDEDEPSCQKNGCFDDPISDKCNQQKCSYGVEITSAGKDASGTNKIQVVCLQQFKFEDQNCQEDSPTACYDAKDNIDDDGNGVWNCTLGVGENVHSPDPNCCPMSARTNDQNQKICVPEINDVIQNCKKGMANFYDSTGDGAPDGFDLNESNWKEVPACQDAAQVLGCTLQ